MSNRKKIAFHTLGCKLNFAETSTLARSFPADEFERVGYGDVADVYVINTCSVTDAADKKCRQAITKVLNQSPRAFVAVVGCYAQLKPEEIAAIPGVDLVLGSNEKFDISLYTSTLKKRAVPEIHSCELKPSDSFFPSWSAGDRTRSFLKVQDGCDYSCTYCTIPMARGKSRNPKIEVIVKEAQEIVASGVKEIVLTGVNTGDFGKSTGENFNDLLKALTEVEGMKRIRVSSIEPNLITDEVIDQFASSGVLMPHFHIPLQSGCNRILGLMARRYRRELFADRLNRIRKLIPHASVGADVIVGFPGETEEDYNDTFNFLLDLPLSYLHVFSYSSRPGTKAENMEGKVAKADITARSKSLNKLSAIKKKSFMEENRGRIDEVLFEGKRAGGVISGFTRNYIRVDVPWQKELKGNIASVKLLEINDEETMNCQLL